MRQDTGTFVKDKIQISGGRVVKIQLWTNESGDSFPHFQIEKKEGEQFCLHRKSPKGSQPAMNGTLEDLLAEMEPAKRERYRHAFSLQGLTKASHIPGFEDCEMVA